MKRLLRSARSLLTACFVVLLLLLVSGTAHNLWIQYGTGLEAKYWRYDSLWDYRKPVEGGGFMPEPGSRLCYPNLYHVWSLYQRSTLEFKADGISGMAITVYGARSGTDYRFEVPAEVAASLGPGVHSISLDTDRDSLGILIDDKVVQEVESGDDYLEDLTFHLGDTQLELLHFRVINTAADTLSEQVDFVPRRVKMLGRLPVFSVVILAGLLFLLFDLAVMGKVTVKPWRAAAQALALHYLPLLAGVAVWRRHPDQPILPFTGLAVSLFLRARYAILARGLFSVRERIASAKDVWRRKVAAQGMVRWSVLALLTGGLLAFAMLPYGYDAPEVLAAWAALMWSYCLAYATLLALLGRFSGAEISKRYLWTFSPLLLTLPWIFAPGNVPKSVVGPVLLCVLLFQFTFLTANRGRLRGYGLLMFLWFAVTLVGFEAWMRSDPGLGRWEKPMGLGKTYIPDDSLFYIPKSLFVRREDFPMRDDFKVYREVNFRSGVIPFSKPAGTFRIIVLGGSNVWGDGVENVRDVFTEVLERRLNSHGSDVKFEVINSGVRGYNSFQLMILDREYLKNYEVDLGILYLNRNDLIHDEGPYTYRELYEMMHAEKGSNWVVDLQHLFRRSFVYNYYTDRMVKSRLWIVDRYSPSESVSKNVNPPEDYAQNLRDLIGQFTDRGAGVMLAAEYWGEAAARNMDLQGDIPEQRELMRSVAGEQGVSFVDVYGILRQNYDVAEIVFAHDLVHCNEAGHRAIAEVIERTLIEQGLVPIEGAPAEAPGEPQPD